MIHIIPTLSDNYTYIIERDEKVIVIDCGETAPVSAFLNERNLIPTSLFCTHHHYDHTDGIKGLKKIYPNMSVLAPHDPRIIDATAIFKDDDFVTAIETPGHTLPHLCYYVESLNALFTGDALFSLGCGRLSEGTADQLFASLQKLKSLPLDTMIYGGHEYTEKNLAFTLANTKWANTKWSHTELDASLQKRANEIKILRKDGQPTYPVSLGQELETNLFLQAETVEDFAKVRKARDVF